MRTTLVLDDSLVQAARHRAVDLGITLGERVNRALRDALERAADTPEPRFTAPTCGGGTQLDHSPGDFWAALGDQDLGIGDR